MSDDRDLESELLRRFQALKSTPTHAPIASSSFREVNDEQVRKAKEEDEELERIADGRIPDRSSHREESEEDVLARRMASLRGGEQDMKGKDDGDEDAEVEAFIASLSAAQLPDRDPEDDQLQRKKQDRSSDRRGLEREAGDILRLTSRHIGRRRSDDSDRESEAEEGHDDLETEDEILQRALEESRLERVGSGSSSSGFTSTKRREVGKADRGNGTSPADQDLGQSANRPATPELSFPTLPSHVPEDVPDDTETMDSEAEARMALLLGLSGPRTAPGPPRLPSPPKNVTRKPGQGWDLPGYKDDRDDDPDSWCCKSTASGDPYTWSSADGIGICNKDADVICLGCDDDPYCESCWMKGHVGERHRTKRFASRGRKRAVGA